MNAYISRRALLGGGLGIGVGMLLAGCSSEEGTASSGPAHDGYPVTLTHAWGDTTVDARPQRVVVVGFKDQDYFLALGTVPVAIREWFGGKPNATWPWATAYLGGEEPEVLPRADLDYEQIAAAEPDVIVGYSAGLTQEQYGRLSDIAPTVAHPSADDAYTVTWQEMTRTTGVILGRQDDAEKLIADLERRIADTAAAHPEFAGKSFVFASAVDGEYYLFGPGATGALVLSSLGLTMPEEVVALTDTADAYYVASPERLDLIDVDLAVWSEAVADEGPAVLLENPLYTGLDVHRQGRDVFLGLDLYNGALSFSSVLSLPLVLDDVVPQLATAIDGDPATRAALSP